jgi:hypothetical protein
MVTQSRLWAKYYSDLTPASIAFYTKHSNSILLLKVSVLFVFTGETSLIYCQPRTSSPSRFDALSTSTHRGGSCDIQECRRGDLWVSQDGDGSEELYLSYGGGTEVHWKAQF